MKAYFSFIKEWLQRHQRDTALALGYLLVAMFFYNLGRFTGSNSAPLVRVEEPTIDLTQVYDTLKTAAAQSNVAGETTANAASPDGALNCEGKIKGNISSSSRIYHVPGGAFYKRTTPEMCFNSEAEAQAAGFRKSQR